MAVTVQMQFESVVTEMYQDAFVGSSIENGVTIITFDLRKLDFQHVLGTTSPICWRKESYHVNIHELSTFHHPILYRCIVAQGSYLDGQNQRMYFTPEMKDVTHHHKQCRRGSNPASADAFVSVAAGYSGQAGIGHCSLPTACNSR